MLRFIAYGLCKAIPTSAELQIGQCYSRRKFALIQTIFQRTISLKLSNEDVESEIRLDNFDEVYPTLKMPYKMRHKEHNETAKEFIKLRLQKYPKRMEPIDVAHYKEIYDHLETSERDKTVNDLNMILDYYNRTLSRSIFCPSSIPMNDMKKMLKDYHTFSGRRRYLHFLFVREFDHWRTEVKEQDRKNKKKEEVELASFSQIGCFDEAGQIQYGYWRNTMFTRFFQGPLHKLTLHRLRTAELFGQKIVIDCSFDETMADYETISVAKQISSIYHANRYSREPFNLLFCGYRESNRGYQHIVRTIKPMIDDTQSFFNLHKQTYQQLLPDQRFIYLSPDARRLMTEFDHEAVYIIGALVSKTHKSKLTLEKAIADGIQCLRLPIHEHVKLKPGVKKVLSFQGVFKILLEMKEHGNWERAFRAGIMSHKLMDDDNCEY